jgi:hypothetical protein
MKAGIHNIPMAEYLADPCLRPSLSAGIAHTLITKSPMHAKAEHPKLSPQYVAKDADKFDIGTASHSMILEGEDKVCVVEADDWRKKESQEKRDDARKNGLTPLLRKHYEAVTQMVGVAKSFMAECEIGPRIKDADAELTMLWQERDLWMRARPDLWSKDRRVLVNYKTSESAEPNTFIRLIPRLGYDLSAAFYERGARILGHQAQEFFVVLEINPPFACSLVGLDPAMREVADSKLALALKAWRRCMETDLWPAYPLNVCYASPTSWELDRAEERRLMLEDK